MSEKSDQKRGRESYMRGELSDEERAHKKIDAEMTSLVGDELCKIAKVGTDVSKQHDANLRITWLIYNLDLIIWGLTPRLVYEPNTDEEKQLNNNQFSDSYFLF